MVFGYSTSNTIPIMLEEIVKGSSKVSDSSPVKLVDTFFRGLKFKYIEISTIYYRKKFYQKNVI